jgi:thiamine-monophosphate kinase
VTFGERRFDSGGPTLFDVGEEELLRRLRELSGAAQTRTGEGAGALVLGPGDDAAVWQPPAAHEVALSQDALVEDRDFRREWITPRALGRRALAVALSDLAAMGAAPAWCTATLCAPADTQLEDVLEIQRGLADVASATGCAIAGGDVSDTPSVLVIDVAVGGTVPVGGYLRRDAGRAGDVLIVTGRLGAAAAGLRVLNGTDAVDDADMHRVWVEALNAPQPRLGEGRHMAAAGVRCAGDISDGLLVEASRTARASRCAAELWLNSVPAAEGLERAFPETWLELALAGGDDFELLCAAPDEVAAGLLASWPAGLAPLRVVGRLAYGSEVSLLSRQGGAALPLPPARSRHWR